jgi:lysophospholipase L1-like esterase
LKKKLLTIFIIILLCFTGYSIFKYISNIKIFEPVTISLNGLDNSEFDYINVYGISPRNKILKLNKLNTLYEWSSYSKDNETNNFVWDSYYCYYKKIILCANDSIINKIKRIDIKIGKEKYTYDNKKFKQQWIKIKGQSRIPAYELPDNVRGNTGIISMLMSVFYLSGLMKTILILSLIIFLCVFFYYSKQYLKSFVRLVYSKLRPFFTKRFKFFKIFLITLFVILIAIHIILLYIGISNVISGIVFILLIAIAIFGICELIFKLLKTKKETIINIKLFTGTFFLALIIVELFLRYAIAEYVTYPEKNVPFYYNYVYGYNYVLNHNIKKEHIFVYNGNQKAIINFKEYKYELNTNSEGLRDREYPVTKSDREYRIIGLGDSFTEGRGVCSDSTWGKFLERGLNSKIKNKKTTVINAGIAGSDIFFEYILLKKRLIKYNPDLVILAINSSDIEDVIIRGGIERFKKDNNVRYGKISGQICLYSLSYIFRHINHDILKRDYLLLKHKERKKQDKKAIKKIYFCILKFKKLSDVQNFDLLIVFHPMSNEVIKGKWEFANIIKKINYETDIQTLNLLDYYLKKTKISKQNISQYYWDIDLHHKARGYKIFAKAIENKILNLDSLDK